jgi:hypothetical protein
MIELNQQRFEHIYLELIPPAPHLCLILPIEKFDELYTIYQTHQKFWLIVQHVDQNLIQTYINMIQYHHQHNQYQKIEAMVIVLNASECQHFELALTWERIKNMTQHLQIELHVLIQVHEVNVPFHLYDLEDSSMNTALLCTFNKFLIYFTGKMDGFQIAKRTMHRLFQLGVPNNRTLFPYFEQAIAPIQKWNLAGLLYTRYDIRSHTPCLCWMKHIEHKPMETYGHQLQYPKPPQASNQVGHTKTNKNNNNNNNNNNQSASYQQTKTCSLPIHHMNVVYQNENHRRTRQTQPRNNPPKQYKRKEPVVKIEENCPIALPYKRFPGTVHNNQSINTNTNTSTSNSSPKVQAPIQLLTKPKTVCVTISTPNHTEEPTKPSNNTLPPTTTKPTNTNQG